jgi:hypothetical protein
MGALPYRPLFVTEADDLYEAMAKLQAKSGAFSTQGTEPIADAALYTDVIAAATYSLTRAAMLIIRLGSFC